MRRNPSIVSPCVKRFGTIFAVYLGVYLVLPGCLCQVLGAFGLSTKSEKRESSTVVESVAANLPCHCHDAPGKFAEAGTATEAEPGGFQWTTSMPDIGVAILPAEPARDLHLGRAPPPGRIPASSRLRDFTRIYLI